MEKREAELKAAFTQEMKQRLPAYVMLAFATAGAPDRSITGHGRTTHWEFKHATPDFQSDGLQELLCMRLAWMGHCRYVIWQESRNGDQQRTLIVHPRKVHEREGWNLEAEAWCIGFNHRWLVEQVRKAHT
jgi:hypothetical protein